MNPFVTCARSFGGYFWLGTESVFFDCFWVNKGCGGWRIHSSHAKRLSRATSEWAATKFSFTVYESPGPVWADESIRHLWKEFQGLYLNGQRVSFPWLFMSQQGLCVLTNPFINCESSFRGPFWEDNDLVFRDCWWVKRGCVGRRIHSSPVKGVSRAFFTRQRVSCPWLLISQQGLWGLTNPFVTCENSFKGYFWVGSNSVFLDCLWVTRGCLGCQIHSPLVKAVSGAISEWAASQFSLNVYESTGVVWADECIRHLCKDFRGLFLTGHRVSFLWLFMSQQRLWGWRIHSSHVKSLSRATSEWAATKFS